MKFIFFFLIFIRPATAQDFSEIRLTPDSQYGELIESLQKISQKHGASKTKVILPNNSYIIFSAPICNSSWHKVLTSNEIAKFPLKKDNYIIHKVTLPISEKGLEKYDKTRKAKLCILIDADTNLILRNSYTSIQKIYILTDGRFAFFQKK